MSDSTILLVDDSSTARMMERMLLQGAPYRVVEACDGLQAINLALSVRPDLILMDVTMPHMDGFSALRVLRERAETKHIPIILVTTRGEVANVETGFAAGCTDYITKPVDRAELLDKIAHWLGRGG